MIGVVVVTHGQLAIELVNAAEMIVGDVPSWRVDHMPYGGVKESGQGREGVRFAMEEMTEVRLFVLRTIPTRSDPGE